MSESGGFDLFTASPRMLESISLFPAPEDQEDQGTKRDLILHRQEHKIRGIDMFTRWYTLDGSKNIASTDIPTCQFVEEGDLFINKLSDGGVQIWLRVSERWSPVGVGHHHPTLAHHRLCLLPHGKPRWVTKQTQTSYKARFLRQKVCDVDL